MNVIHSVEKYLIVDGLTLAHARELEQALSKVFGTHYMCFRIYGASPYEVCAVCDEKQTDHFVAHLRSWAQGFVRRYQSLKGA